MITDPEKKLTEKVLALLLLFGYRGEELAKNLKHYISEACIVAKGADKKGMLQYAASIVQTSTEQGLQLQTPYYIEFTTDWKEGVCVKVVLRGLQLEGQEASNQQEG